MRAKQVPDRLPQHAMSPGRPQRPPPQLRLAVTPTAACRTHPRLGPRRGRLYLQAGVPCSGAPLAPGSVCVRPTGDARGNGAFAAAPIPAGTHLGDYTGELLGREAFYARYPDGVVSRLAGTEGRRAGPGGARGAPGTDSAIAGIHAACAAMRHALRRVAGWARSPIAPTADAAASVLAACTRRPLSPAPPLPLAASLRWHVARRARPPRSGRLCGGRGRGVDDRRLSCGGRCGQLPPGECTCMPCCAALRRAALSRATQPGGAQLTVGAGTRPCAASCLPSPPLWLLPSPSSPVQPHPASSPLPAHSPTLTHTHTHTA